MIALRYFCGFFLQIFPYAFFCMFPFRDRFRGSRKRAVFIALSIFALMVIPFCTVAQLNVGGAYKEMICPLSSRQVKYLKVSDKNTYISFWSVGIFMHTISLYIF